MPTDNNTKVCSFCGKKELDAGRLIYGPGGINICERCVYLCEELLEGKGAWRVHGGGFAGTIQAFVPVDMLADFKRRMELVFGEGNCYVLSIRPVGGVNVI